MKELKCPHCSKKIEDKDIPKSIASRVMIRGRKQSKKQSDTARRFTAQRNLNMWGHTWTPERIKEYKLKYGL